MTSHIVFLENSKYCSLVPSSACIIYTSKPKMSINRETVIWFCRRRVKMDNFKSRLVINTLNFVLKTKNLQKIAVFFSFLCAKSEKILAENRAPPWKNSRWRPWKGHYATLVQSFTQFCFISIRTSQTALLIVVALPCVSGQAKFAIHVLARPQISANICDLSNTLNVQTSE